MGMTDWQLLIRVELPLAAGVILAGVRIATVISVGIATIAAAIGGGGLGVFIFRGISTVNNQLILAGGDSRCDHGANCRFWLRLAREKDYSTEDQTFKI